MAVTRTAMPDPTGALGHPFMQRALVAALCCGVACACIGTHLVARRMTFVGSALTHTLLPGIAAAFLLGFSPYLGALGAAAVTAGLIALAGVRREGREDAAIGVAQSALFAAGVLIMARSGSWRDFGGMLFGSVLGVGEGDLAWTAALAAGTVATLLAGHRALEAAAVDEDYARGAGLRPELLRIGLVLLAGAAAASAVGLLGAMLTSALLIVPAAGGLLLGRSLAGAMAWASAIAATGVTAGLIASYHIEALPSGAAMVGGCCAGFALARAWRALRG
jgi:manganese/iron transport system permease protein